MDTNKIWDSFIEEIKKSTSKLSFDMFFSDLSLYKLDVDNKIIYIQLEDISIIKFLREKYIVQIEDIFSRMLGDDFQVVIKSKDEYKSNKIDKKKKVRKSLYKDNSKLFNPKFNFENFVVGGNNRFAYAASLAVAESPAEAYNPLFLYGGSGLGKTHLMQAIGIQVIKNDPTSNVLYISSETFTNELIEAINTQNTNQFKEKYRNIDILLIDDIQFLEGKEATQEEFFHTFNTLYENNKQIVISSDRPPSNLQKLDERLTTRFGFGITADVQPADFETRVAILKKKIELADIELDSDIEEVCNLIAEKIKYNIRELEGAMNRMISFSEIMNNKIDLDFAKIVLKDIYRDTDKAIAPERIRSTVASYYDIKVSDLDSKRRTAEIALARQVAMYLCRESTDFSFSKIGEIFGGRDHSTVMSNCNKIQTLYQEDELIKYDIDEINKKLKKHDL
ncbi:MAG: chromosomal replication initiator protein DnaA [Mogibacterium diversum]|uniref:chromosomal replication initiator protein DnaA n=1 Tax=Mogibacterium TaxID=86331 RepID=UPI0018561095|nr:MULTISPECIES: chromosomal replication initiator protein DnaA [Mogibacterium]MBB1532873.1 chromosomal replication initiator protein DnaA [Mogibacterium sp.]MBB1547724.1 chromosomal replication initiator protein DnaA [Mogibacterium sp.]MBF1328428.1 chromosomal replication initiator protein DnaA [Mogibacterium diversum]MBF1338010.1 chromosomal replication initiator protein DnaA [Mogibacterium diversum]MBF1341115.1 chromosomal replication initiator protein DnaA [Mogibacterium diversum]